MTFFAGPVDPSTLLWHYTNWRGLEGMADKHTLWASDAAYLNDSQELKFALEVLARQLPEAGVSPAICEELLAHAPLVTHDCAVISFSEAMDDLSQWRAYGNPAPGFAIGFDRQRLSEIGEALNFTLRECVYTAEEHHAYVHEFAEQVLRQLNSIRVERPDAVTLGRGASMRRILGWLERAPELKHEKFAHERERRLVCFTVDELSPSWTAHSSGSLVVPHYNLELGDCSQTPIRAVMVGPSPHPELLVAGIRKFMASKDLLAPVYRSTIPLRNW